MASTAASANFLPRLKPLRTYYVFSGDTTLAHHFFYRVQSLANYAQPGEVSVVDIDDARSAGERNFRPAHARFGNEIAMPDDVQAIAGVLTKRLADLNSRARIELRYDGYFQDFQLNEIIAFDPEGRERRNGHVTEARVRRWPDGRQIIHPVNLYQRGELHHAINRLGAFARVIDHALPAEIDGSSLLAMGDQCLIPTAKHAEAYCDLLGALRFPRLIAGPIDQQLAHLEARVGPRPPAQQHFAFNMSILGYLPNEPATIRGRTQFLIPTDHLVAGTIDQSLVNAEFGYELRLRGSLRSGFVVGARDLESGFVVERDFHLTLDTPFDIDPRTGRVTMPTEPRFLSSTPNLKLHARGPFQMMEFALVSISPALATGLKCMDLLEPAMPVDSRPRLP